MEKREIKEVIKLLTMVREYIVEDRCFYGMCGVAQDLLFNGINIRERSVLLTYIDERQPPRSKMYDYGFWWKRGNKKPRLRWLDKEIAALKLKLKEDEN